jgi:DNA modification methylase
MIEPYYQHGGITIYNADCREILPGLPKVDLVLTDPPYGVDLGNKARNQKLASVPYSGFDDSADTVVSLVNEVLVLCFEKSTRTVITPGVKNMWSYPKPDHCGSFFYPAANGCNPWGFSCWQPIFYYGKDPFGGSGSQPDSFVSTEAAIRNGHPCPKPIGQWSKLLKRVSLPGESVLDPFMGSGTTLLAAKMLGLSAVGIELTEEYCEIAAKRLEVQYFDFEPLPDFIVTSSLFEGI